MSDGINEADCSDEMSHEALRLKGCRGVSHVTMLWGGHPGQTGYEHWRNSKKTRVAGAQRAGWMEAGGREQWEMELKGSPVRIIGYGNSIQGEL